jgi:hypothetical protein
VYPHLEFLEQHRIPRLLDIIKTQHESFVGKTGFEELARRLLIQLGDTHQLSFVPDYIGRVWSKRVEIDVVATSKTSRTILFGECKWSGTPVNEAILDRLIHRSALLPRIQPYKIHYALFSKSGFTATLMDRARKEHILLFKGANFERVN